MREEKIKPTNPMMCDHGSLKRSCYICELEAERDRLKVELESLHMTARNNYEESKANREFIEKDSDLWKSKYEELSQEMTRQEESFQAQLDKLTNERNNMADDFIKNELDRVTWKSKAEKLAEAFRKMLSPEMDWENGEIGVGSNFRQIAKAALAEFGEGK